jgi:hypothetical protein
VHQEFRVLSLMDNPCCAVEFPVSVAKSTRKPHFMTGSEQARIEGVAPDYLRNIVVILSEMGLRPFKELLPMKQSQFENGEWHRRHADDPAGAGCFPAANRRDAWKRVSVSQPQAEREEAAHDLAAQGVGDDARKGGRALSGIRSRPG